MTRGPWALTRPPPSPPHTHTPVYGARGALVDDSWTLGPHQAPPPHPPTPPHLYMAHVEP